ncbi:MAG TPA: glycosyltransferase [Pirellulales bacterium]|nr:glycosyltransferase [Pirellulales bacterium]
MTNPIKAIVTPSLDPKYGGPSVSIPALVDAMHTIDSTARLYAAGPSWQGEPSWPTYVLRYPDARPLRLRRSPQLRAALLRDELTIVHHHALWLPTLGYSHQAARRHRCPLVVSPRGMLSPYALARSRWRKKLAACCIPPGALRDAAGWHATSDDEARDIRQAGFHQPIVVARNGVTVPAWHEAVDRHGWHERYPQLAGKRVALFFSRLHSVKGILPLLNWWSESKATNDWHLLVAGSADEYTLDDLAAHAARLKISGRVTLADPVGLAKPYPLAELYILPSASENFGLTVAEALVSGVPTLVSANAPWHEINGIDAGRCVPLDDFPKQLDALLRRSPDELKAMGGRGRDFVRSTFSWQQQARLLLEFYDKLVAAG